MKFIKTATHRSPAQRLATRATKHINAQIHTERRDLSAVSETFSGAASLAGGRNYSPDVSSSNISPTPGIMSTVIQNAIQDFQKNMQEVAFRASIMSGAAPALVSTDGQSFDINDMPGIFRSDETIAKKSEAPKEKTKFETKKAYSKLQENLNKLKQEKSSLEEKIEASAATINHPDLKETTKLGMLKGFLDSIDQLEVSAKELHENMKSLHGSGKLILSEAMRKNESESLDILLGELNDYKERVGEAYNEALQISGTEAENIKTTSPEVLLAQTIIEFENKDKREIFEEGKEYIKDYALGNKTRSIAKIIAASLAFLTLSKIYEGLSQSEELEEEALKETLKDEENSQSKESENEALKDEENILFSEEEKALFRDTANNVKSKRDLTPEQMERFNKIHKGLIDREMMKHVDAQMKGTSEIFKPDPENPTMERNLQDALVKKDSTSIFQALEKYADQILQEYESKKGQEVNEHKHLFGCVLKVGAMAFKKGAVGTYEKIEGIVGEEIRYAVLKGASELRHEYNKSLANAKSGAHIETEGQAHGR